MMLFGKRIILALMVFLVGFGVVCALAGGGKGAEKESRARALELVDKYAQALDSTLSFIEHHEKTTKFSYRVAGRQDEGTSLERGQFRYDDQRFYLQAYQWGDFGNKDLSKDTPHYTCNISDGRKKILYQNHRQLNTPDRSGSAARLPNPRPEQKVVLSKHFGVSYIVGYIGSNERLDSILRKADSISVRKTTENVRGSECFVLDADTKYGRYTVWFDPEHGFHPSKARRRAKEGEYTHAHLMLKGETTFTYLDTISFEKVDGIWVPMEANAGCDRVAVGGDFVKDDYHYKRTDIILNPDHDKLGSFADPIFEDPNNDPELVNGTRVRLKDPEIEYTWQDGKLVDKDGREVDMDKLKVSKK